MTSEDLSAFVAAYTSGGSHRIAVRDQNAEFRRTVGSYILEHLEDAPSKLLADVAINEAIWGRSADVSVVLVGRLLSHLLDARGTEELSTLLECVGHNMDLDGHLQSGGLVLEENTRESLLTVLDRWASGSSSEHIKIGRNAVANATLVDHNGG